MDSRTFILTNFNNQNIHKMKTRNVNYNRSILNAFFIVFIVILSGCGSGGSKSGSDEKQQAEQQTAVKPPAVDIFTAAFLGDLDAVEQHIQAGTDLNQREPTMGSTPLISAAVFGKTEVARALMEAGADVNSPSYRGIPLPDRDRRIVAGPWGGQRPAEHLRFHPARIRGGSVQRSEGDL
jgi:hypothetical protein